MTHTFTWTRSSLPVPMSPLEFDILAAPYSQGYGRALSAVLQTPIRVVNRLVAGHLYTALASDASKSA